MPLAPFDSTYHLSALITIWNAACGTGLAITPRLAAYVTRPATGAVHAGRIAWQDDQPIGFVLASALPNDPQTSPPAIGWIEAIAVLGSYQRRGVGGALLAWAEDWLRAQGCARVRLGGGLRYWTPGYPVELGDAAFFRARGYSARAIEPQVCDLARDLRDYAPMRRCADAMIRPAQASDTDAILEFLWREFPGRWRFEFEEFLRERGRISDYMILLTARGIAGTARLTFEDSERPIERYYMHRLPRPWGQLGSIGVSADARGQGYGGALLDASLCHLRDSGVRGCVIDWTGLADFYAKFGFKPYRGYAMLSKNL